MRSIKSNSQHSRRNALLVAGGLLVLAIAYTGTAYAMKLWPFGTTTSEQSSQGSASTTTTTDSEPPTDETKATGSPAPATPVPGTTNTAKDTPAQSSDPQPSGAISIPFAQQNGDILQITTLITGVKSTDTCTLTLTKGSTVITLPPVGVQAGPSSSTCQGFNVSIPSQPQLTAGTWNISIAVSSDPTKPATSKVTIK